MLQLPRCDRFMFFPHFCMNQVKIKKIYIFIQSKSRSCWSGLVQARVLAREDQWLKRGVEEAIHVKLEKPPLNRGGGLRRVLSPMYGPVRHSVRKQNKFTQFHRTCCCIAVRPSGQREKPPSLLDRRRHIFKNLHRCMYSIVYCLLCSLKRRAYCLLQARFFFFL